MACASAQLVLMIARPTVSPVRRPATPAMDSTATTVLPANLSLLSSPTEPADATKDTTWMPPELARLATRPVTLVTDQESRTV